MADGQILIDSKLDTQGVQKGVDEIQGLFVKTAETAAKAANNIEKAFKNTNYKDAFEKLPASYQSAYAKIETIRANDSLSEKQRATQIASVYRELGYNQQEALARAWDAIKSDSETGSHHIIENLYEIQDAAKKTGDEVEKSGEKAKDAGDTFEDMFKAHLSADALLGTLKAVAQQLIELGKQAVAAAAEVAASNAQFEQTFAGVESTARKALNSISKETGVTATRMQGSFTKIFAFTKSVGGDTESAMDISSRALRAAADSAAYYDRSLEETTESLMSFLKGNYENDSALGIAATETTRNTAANKKYAKSFDQLSESQKVDVLLSMVEAGNEASGALGQASREADQWANVTGELSEAWKKFLASIGTPILEAITPIVKGITAALNEMTEAAPHAELAQGMKDFSDAIADANADYEESAAAIEHNAIKADILRQRLEELAPEVSTSAEASREYANAVALLNEIYPELNLQIDDQTGLLTKNSEAQLVNIDAMKQRALAAAKEKRYSALLDAQAEATLDLYEAQKKLQDGEADLVSVQQQLQDEFGYTADELNELFRQYDESGAKSGNDLIDKFVELRQQLPVLKANVDDATDAVEEQDTAIAELAKTLGDTTDATGQLSTAQGEAATATTELTEEQKALAEEFQNVKESAMDSLDSTTGMFEKMDSTATTSIASMTESLNSNAATLSAYSENLRKALEMGYAPELVQQWAAGDAESMAMVAAAVQGTTTDVNTLNAAFNNYTASRGNTASVQASIVTGFNAIGDAAASASTKIESGLVTPTVDSAGTMQQAMTNAFTASGEAVTDEWTNKGQWFADNVEKPIKSSSENMEAAVSGDAETMSGNFTGKMGDMESANSAAWQNMYGDVAYYIGQIQGEIDSLHGKTVPLTFRTSVSPYSASQGNPVAVQTAQNPEIAMGIPYLASGAVIPPNAPFMAVLGDQKSGTNIEAPLETIKQALADVLTQGGEDITINFTGDLAALARVLTPSITRQQRRAQRSKGV